MVSKTTAIGMGLCWSPTKRSFSRWSYPHEDSSFVDVYLHNPQSWLSGWSIQLEGATFTAMTPLFDTTGYAHLFHMSLRVAWLLAWLWKTV